MEAEEFKNHKEFIKIVKLLKSRFKAKIHLFKLHIFSLGTIIIIFI